MGPVDSSSIHQSLKCVLHTKAKDYFLNIKLGQVWKKKREKEGKRERESLVSSYYSTNISISIYWIFIIC